MPEPTADMVYFMRRAKEEAWLALQSDRPEIASAHHGLSVEYARLARSAFPQFKPRD